MFDITLLAHNIKKYRESKGISQKELAEKLFVSGQAISKWERGLAVPEIDKLCTLADLFGTSLDSLVGCLSDNEISMIGIDGGGTKTEYVLFNEKGMIFERIVTDGTNPNFYGRDKVLETLKSGIRTLLAVKPNVKGIYVGAAGFLTSGNGEYIKNSLKDSFPSIKIKCTSDMLNAIASATEDEKCLGSISGTGNTTFVYKDDKITRYGGYGVLFDKAGSGYDIGRDAMYAALEEADGLGEKTLITPLVENKLGDSVIKMLQQLYSADVSYIASFSMAVFEAYAKGDKVAKQIVERNTDRIAYVINKAYEKNPDCKTLALAGSLYKNEYFLESVKKKLNPELKCVISENPPVYGACVLCCKMLGVNTEGLKDNFMNDYKAYLDMTGKREFV